MSIAILSRGTAGTETELFKIKKQYTQKSKGVVFSVIPASIHWYLNSKLTYSIKLCIAHDIAQR